jgi:hypothetical protein
MFMDFGQTFVRRSASTLIDKFGSEITLCCKLLITQGKFLWLGGRDSNPDNVVQSHVSYR